MNIKEAKEQIKNAMTAYFSKDETGEYIMPPEHQRPVFLMGAPGIGKTAVMEQIASEMGVALLSYSMSHHTRQSALGLPYIVKKCYDGVEYEVSEYTMSEIIASIYDLMEKTGLKEGILFLDEINCVSETLAPVMLQFLQYKVFGRHHVPSGWIVVTAGNPPEYNNSVRDFDIVTWDRLKRIDVEPDLDVWKEYAAKVNVHPAITTYLEIKSGDFYRVETTVNGKSFVTARGWEDLSRMIRLYEQNGIKVDVRLVGQYLQNERIARDFAQYYDLFQKYRSDYQVPRILEGNSDGAIITRAHNAKFDERLSLIGLLMEACNNETRAVMEQNRLLTALMDALKQLRVSTVNTKMSPRAFMEQLAREADNKLKTGKSASSMSVSAQRDTRLFIRAIGSMTTQLTDEMSAKDAFAILKKDFDAEVQKLKDRSADVKRRLSNMFRFAEQAFGSDQEMLIIVTELTANADSAGFIARFGCDEYFSHNRELLLYERRQDITGALEELKLDGLLL